MTMWAGMSTFRDVNLNQGILLQLSQDREARYDSHSDAAAYKVLDVLKTPTLSHDSKMHRMTAKELVHELFAGEAIMMHDERYAFQFPEARPGP